MDNTVNFKVQMEGKFLRQELVTYSETATGIRIEKTVRTYWNDDPSVPIKEKVYTETRETTPLIGTNFVRD